MKTKPEENKGRNMCLEKSLTGLDVAPLPTPVPDTWSHGGRAGTSKTQGVAKAELYLLVLLPPLPGVQDHRCENTMASLLRGHRVNFLCARLAHCHLNYIPSPAFVFLVVLGTEPWALRNTKRAPSTLPLSHTPRSRGMSFDLTLPVVLYYFSCVP